MRYDHFHSITESTIYSLVTFSILQMNKLKNEAIPRCWRNYDEKDTIVRHSTICTVALLK